MNELTIKMYTKANGVLNGVKEIESETLPFLYARDLTHHGFQPPFEVSEADETRIIDQFSKLFAAQEELFDLFRQAERKALKSIIKTKGHEAAKADYFNRHLSENLKALKRELAATGVETPAKARAQLKLEKEEARLLADYTELLRA